VQRGRSANLVGVVAMILCGLPVMLLARPFMALFTDVPEVIAIGVIYLWAVALAEPFMCLGITAGGALRGAGDTKPTLYYTIIAQWLVRLPMGYVLAFSFGLQEHGLWIALVLLSVVQGLLTWRKFRRGLWLDREI
jgi:Na+-driven multidrug efflux pump